MRIAIYDLDRTLAKAPTFTPFLVYAARRLAPARLALLPSWILAMLGYRLGLYSRTALKRFGMKLMLGRHARGNLRSVSREFAAHHIARGGWRQDVAALLAEDRARGAHIAIATAAFEFYAREFADLLVGIDAVIATRWDGAGIPGGNCYGREKLARVEAWLRAESIDPATARIRFVSDSFADAPLLERAEEPVFITDSESKKRRAAANGWRVL